MMTLYQINIFGIDIYFYSATPLKQQSMGRHVAPLGHIIVIPSPPFFCSFSLLLRAQLRIKKNLKIPMEYSESVNRRRTDNTIAKRKGTNGQPTVEFESRLTRQIPLVEQEFLLFRSTRVHLGFQCGSCYSMFSFVDLCLFFSNFSFGQCCSVLFRFTDYDYLFGIFEICLKIQRNLYGSITEILYINI